MTPVPVPRGPSDGRLYFLDCLRAIAVLLVLWDHLVATWLDRQGLRWGPLTLSRRFVTGPLAITQNAGWLGVVLFFLVSGFVISHVGSAESMPAFAVRRFLRIYPPLAVAVIVAVLVALVRHHWQVGLLLRSTETAPVPSLGDAVRSAGLVNYYLVPQRIVLGVAWTLCIEVIFYVLVFATMPMLKRRPAIASGLILLAVVAVLQTARSFGPSWFLFAASISYLPLLVLGQLLWALWARRVHWLSFAALTLAAWVLFLHGLELLQPQFLGVTSAAYGPSVAIAYSVFVTALLLAGHVRHNPVIDYVATRSYSMYLLHGTIGVLALDVAARSMRYLGALPIALLVIAGCCEVQLRLVERPAQRLARAISRPREAPTTPASSPRSSMMS